MKRISFVLLLSLCFCAFLSCGSSERTVTITPRPVEIVQNDLSADETEKPPAASDTDGQSGDKYILNIGSMKIHTPQCSGVKQMKEENKEEYIGTLDDLIAKGYEPCGTCKPQ